MKRKFMICLLFVGVLLIVFTASFAENQEEQWSDYDIFVTEEFEFGYRVSPEGNVRIESFFRKVNLKTFSVSSSYQNGKLKDIEIGFPDEIHEKPVTEIAPFLLMNISTPTSIILPKHLLVIGGYAFSRCSRLAKEVVIPEKTEVIEAYAFSSCPELKSVVIPETVQRIEEGAFTDCPRLVLTVVPASCGEAYAIASSIPYVCQEE